MRRSCGDCFMAGGDGCNSLSALIVWTGPELWSGFRRVGGLEVLLCRPLYLSKSNVYGGSVNMSRSKSPIVPCTI